MHTAARRCIPCMLARRFVRLLCAANVAGGGEVGAQIFTWGWWPKIWSRCTTHHLLLRLCQPQSQPWHSPALRAVQEPGLVLAPWGWMCCHRRHREFAFAAGFAPRMLVKWLVAANPGNVDHMTRCLIGFGSYHHPCGMASAELHDNASCTLLRPDAAGSMKTPRKSKFVPRSRVEVAANDCLLLRRPDSLSTMFSSRMIRKKKCTMQLPNSW